MAFIDRSVGALDLRLKLQKKSNQRATLGAKGSLSGGVRDLREKLSGVSYSQPAAKPKPVPETTSKPARRSVVADANVTETKKVSTNASKRKKVYILLLLLLLLTTKLLMFVLRKFFSSLKGFTYLINLCVL